MKQLTKVVQALSGTEVSGIRQSFVRPDDKIARLFELLNSGKPDKDIRTELGLSGNSYSALKSRLYKRIQDYLIRSIDGPNTDVLKKVLSIDELMFTSKRSIALSTLKRLEAELLSHDLSYELTIVYKHLKKLHVNTPEYFHYSKQYNKHVAYRLALDKAEDILAQYFKAYSFYFVMGDKDREVELKALFEEMVNVCSLYSSHRMFVYQSVVQAFQSLFVDESTVETYKLRPVEDILKEAEEVVANYESDSIYRHLQLLVKYVKFEYYMKFGVKQKAKLLLEELDPSILHLLSHYDNYAFPSKMLDSKLKVLLGTEELKELHYINRETFENFEDTSGSIPALIVYYTYRAMSSYYRSRYDEAYKWLYELTTEVGFKEYQHTYLEIRALMAFFKLMDKDKDLFIFNLGTVQRLLRQIGKENAGHLGTFVKLLSVAKSDVVSTKAAKAKRLAEELKQFPVERFQPILLIDWEPRVMTRFEN